MNGNLRANVEEIFHAARQKAASAERAAFLEGACRGDAALRAKVDALLKADADAGSFLESIGPRATPAGAPPSEQSGQLIGHYKLLQLLGEGGFGSVWMAEQREPVKRRVALKVIKLGMDTKQVIARFELERQALAMMDHPNIAKVLDAGSTETGRPFFVMELVRGVPILEYCDTERVDTRTRLELFVSVCQAIQHAHQKGIIHRDIKPNNVLVTMHDGVPVPKVIDFGVAKATNAELTERTLFTEHRQMIGTPAYMSPEQAEMSGLDIDTRSDIYSLGVLLYELLTGTTPFDIQDLLSKGFAELMRVIREVEPHKPSTRVSTLGDSATRTAQQRHVADPRKLGLLLRGDLDWIVMKCLEKDRTRRYETATGLAADILRHLHDEPVVASPPSAAYRLAKFVRRNRRQVIAAGCVVAALVLGVIGTTWGMLRALEQKRRAEDAVEDTKLQLARANEVKQLITRMLEGVTPEEARGADTQILKRILDDTAARLDRGDVDDELVAAELHDLVAKVERSLARLESAERHERATLAIFRRRLSPEHSEARKATSNLAAILAERGRYDEAERLLEELLAIERRTLGEEAPDTLFTQQNLARTWVLQGRAADALPLYRKVLDARRRLLGEEHDDTLDTMHGMALLHEQLGRFDEAVELARKVLDARRRRLGEDHPATLDALDALATLLSHLGRYPEAEGLHREILAISRRVSGEEHPATLRTMNNLATVLGIERRHAEALELVDRGLEIGRRVQGDEHPDTLGSRVNRANLLRALGRHREAEEEGLRAIELGRRVVSEDHPTILAAMNNLALVYRDEGRLADAEKLQLEVLRIQEESLGEEHPNTLSSRMNLADLYRDTGRVAEAAPLYAAVLAARRRSFGARHPETMKAMRALARTCEVLGRDAEALALERELLDVAVALAQQPATDAATLNNTAWALLTHPIESLRDPARALPLARRACEKEAAASGVGLWGHLDTLALAQHLTGDAAGALQTQRRAIAFLPENADSASAAELQAHLHEYEAALKGAGDGGEDSER